MGEQIQLVRRDSCGRNTMSAAAANIGGAGFERARVGPRLTGAGRLQIVLTCRGVVAARWGRSTGRRRIPIVVASLRPVVIIVIGKGIFLSITIFRPSEDEIRLRARADQQHRDGGAHADDQEEALTHGSGAMRAPFHPVSLSRCTTTQACTGTCRDGSRDPHTTLFPREWTGGTVNRREPGPRMRERSLSDG